MSQHDELDPRTIPVPGANPGASKDADRYLFSIWMAVLTILGVTLFLFGILAFFSRNDPSTAAFLMAPATTALGFIGGVLAPSPTAIAGSGKTS